MADDRIRSPGVARGAGGAVDRNIGQTRVLIADDHPIFRDGLRKLLEIEGEFLVVGEAADGAEAIKLLHQVKADLLLLDLAMPRYSGMEVLHELASSATPRTIVLAAVIEKAEMLEALRLGARGIVSKESSTKSLAAAIRSVMAGQYWVGQENVSDLIGAVRDVLPSRTSPKMANSSLTPREREVMEAIVGGRTNRDIAKGFSISQQTVKHHITKIFEKLGVSNRVELALLAVKHQLVETGRVPE